MTRFADTFARLADRGACGLFPYLTAGFPDPATGRALVRSALEAGADGLEIGVPFSDPLADGATLQRANARALEAGATLDTALEMVALAREVAPTAPVALMSYANPLLRRGVERFAADLTAAGGDAVIVPDLPPEEAADLDAALAAHGLDLVGMLAPTTPDARLARVAGAARGFLYCVSLVGVTGARQEVSASLGDFLARVRAASPLPRVVGFGIATPDHVRAVAALGAEGVIVASALADLVERSDDPVTPATDFLRRLAAATGRVPA